MCELEIRLEHSRGKLFLFQVLLSARLALLVSVYSGKSLIGPRNENNSYMHCMKNNLNSFPICALEHITIQLIHIIYSIQNYSGKLGRR